MNATASAWVAFAKEDLRVAELAYDEDIWNQVCFHAQQSVEKMLKATIADSGGSTPQVHRLVDLLVRIQPNVQAALATLVPDIQSLDRFYIPTRYPDALPGSLPSGLPAEPEATAALAVAKRVVALVDQLLGTAQGSTP